MRRPTRSRRRRDQDAASTARRDLHSGPPRNRARDDAPDLTCWFVRPRQVRCGPLAAHALAPDVTDVPVPRCSRCCCRCCARAGAWARAAHARGCAPVALGRRRAAPRRRVGLPAPRRRGPAPHVRPWRSATATSSAAVRHDALEGLYGRLNATVLDIWTRWAPANPSTRARARGRALRRHPRVCAADVPHEPLERAALVAQQVHQRDAPPLFRRARAVRPRHGRAGPPVCQSRMITAHRARAEPRARARIPRARATDLGTAHPTWFSKKVDAIFVPGEAVRSPLLSRRSRPAALLRPGPKRARARAPSCPSAAMHVEQVPRGRAAQRRRAGRHRSATGCLHPLGVRGAHGATSRRRAARGVREPRRARAAPTADAPTADAVVSPAAAAAHAKVAKVKDELRAELSDRPAASDRADCRRRRRRRRQLRRIVMRARPASSRSRAARAMRRGARAGDARRRGARRARRAGDAAGANDRRVRSQRAARVRSPRRTSGARTPRCTSRASSRTCTSGGRVRPSAHQGAPPRPSPSALRACAGTPRGVPSTRARARPGRGRSPRPLPPRCRSSSRAICPAKRARQRAIRR